MQLRGLSLPPTLLGHLERVQTSVLAWLGWGVVIRRCCRPRCPAWAAPGQQVPVPLPGRLWAWGSTAGVQGPVTTPAGPQPTGPTEKWLGSNVSAQVSGPLESPGCGAGGDACFGLKDKTEAGPVPGGPWEGPICPRRGADRGCVPWHNCMACGDPQALRAREAERLGPGVRRHLRREGRSGLSKRVLGTQRRPAPSRQEGASLRRLQHLRGGGRQQGAGPIPGAGSPDSSLRPPARRRRASTGSVVASPGQGRAGQEGGRCWAQ